MLYPKRGQLKFSWYPHFLDPDATAKVQKFIQKDLKKYPALLLRVHDFLSAVEKVENLDSYYKSEEMAKLDGALHEMRIPPKRRGGVVRIYFCVNPEDSREIMLLDAELKHETKPGRTDTANCRLKEYLAYLARRKQG